MKLKNHIRDRLQELESTKKSTNLKGYCVELESLLHDAIKTIDVAINQEETFTLSNDLANNTLSGIHVYRLEDINDDSTLRMVYANTASEILTGVKVSDIIGKTLDENFPGLRDKGIPQAYAEVVRTGKTFEVEDLYYNDERVIEGAFLIKAFPLPGNQVGISFENIIELKKYQKKIEEDRIALKEQNEEFLSINEELKESNRRIQEFNDILSKNEAYQNSIFKAAPIGIGVVKNRHFSFMNDYLCDMTGYSKEELIGQSARIIYPDDHEFERVGKEKYEQINKYGTGTVETRFKTKDGCIIDILLSSTPIDINDHSRGITFSALDITDRKKAVAEVKKIFDLSADLICIASLDGYFQRINPAFNKILGYEDHELLDQPFFNFIHPDDIELTKEIITEKLKNNILVINFQNRYRCKDGSYKWFLWTSQPIPEENRTYAIARDITDIKNKEKELLESKQKLEEAQRIGKIGHYNLMVEKGTWTCTETLDEIFGNSKDDIRNIELWTSMLHPDDREEMVNYLQNEVIGNHKKFDKEYRIINLKTNKTKWVHGIGNLKIENGKVVSMFGTIQDITKRKNYESKILENEKSLKESNEEYLALNEELHAANNKMYKINQELIAAKLKAEESDHLKTAFLANMSHEIRTPMNGIIGFTNLLSDEELTKEKREHYIEIINNSAKQLLTIISDIIDIAKIEAGQIDIIIKSFEINPLLLELQEQFETEKTKKDKENIDIVCDIPYSSFKITSDEVRIKQILTNLLSNALKFTSQGYIKFGYTYENDQLLFYVEDSGKGISKENIDIIFNRFRQEEDSHIREFGGTGLGLSISKALVEKLGGKIWVRSEKNKGSIFYFSVSTDAIVEEPETPMKEQIIENLPNWKDKTILLVEDMEITQILINEIVEPTGANILITDSGLEAIDICRNKNPDLILMDIQLPDLNGYDVTKTIRTFNLKVPIIAQTAYAMSGDDIKAIEAGCNDYISKPYKRIKLINMMNKYLNSI